MSTEIEKVEGFISAKWNWLKANKLKALFFVLATAFLLLWIRTVSVNGYLHRQNKKEKKINKRLTKEIVETKKDFYSALKQIEENEKIKPVLDTATTVSVLFNKMRERFETDGVAYLKD